MATQLEISKEYRLVSGKWQGWSIEELCSSFSGREYAIWAAANHPNPAAKKAFSKFLKEIKISNDKEFQVSMLEKEMKMRGEVVEYGAAEEWVERQLEIINEVSNEVVGKDAESVLVAAGVQNATKIIAMMNNTVEYVDSVAEFIKMHKIGLTNEKKVAFEKAWQLL